MESLGTISHKDVVTSECPTRQHLLYIHVTIRYIFECVKS